MPTDQKKLQEWYEKALQTGLVQKNGSNEISEDRAADWSRLRVWDGQRFVSAMPNGHTGKPTAVDLEWLYDHAQKGNLFFYREGEIYPHKYTGEAWRTTDLGQGSGNVYEQLNNQQRSAIRYAVPQRRAEINRNDELLRVELKDRKELREWYVNNFRKSLDLESGANELDDATMGDWNRVRIWDGEKLAPVMPEGHVGPPTYQAIARVRTAAESGNLFIYRQGEKCPDRWNGEAWKSMDGGAIEASKPELQLPERPQLIYRDRPTREVFNQAADINFSPARVTMNRFFNRFGITVFKDDYDNSMLAEARYERAMSDYQAIERQNQEAQAKYERDSAEARRKFEEDSRVWEERMAEYNKLSDVQKKAVTDGIPARESAIESRQEIQTKQARDASAKEVRERNILENANENIRRLFGDPPAPNPYEVAGEVPNLGEGYLRMVAPQRYVLPPNSLISPVDMPVINLALTGSNQAIAAHGNGLPPINNEMYSNIIGVTLLNQAANVHFGYMAAGFAAGQQYIAAYNAGQPEQLGRGLGEGLNRINEISSTFNGMNRIEVGGVGIVAGRILNVLENHKDLVPYTGLTQEQIQYARGTAALGKIYQSNLNAQINLIGAQYGRIHLSPEAKANCMGDVMLNGLAGQVMAADHNRAYPEGNPTGPQARYRVVSQFRVKLGEPDKMEVIQKVYRLDPVLGTIAQELSPEQIRALGSNLPNMGKTVTGTDLANPAQSPTVQLNVQQSVSGFKQERAMVEQYMINNLNGRRKEDFINDFTIERKLEELRAAQKLLQEERNDRFALTSREVIERAEQMRAERAARYHRIAEDVRAEMEYEGETFDPVVNDDVAELTDEQIRQIREGGPLIDDENEVENRREQPFLFEGDKENEFLIEENDDLVNKQEQPKEEIEEEIPEEIIIEEDETEYGKEQSLLIDEDGESKVDKDSLIDDEFEVENREEQPILFEDDKENEFLIEENDDLDNEKEIEQEQPIKEQPKEEAIPRKKEGETYKEYQQRLQMMKNEQAMKEAAELRQAASVLGKLENKIYLSMDDPHIAETLTELRGIREQLVKDGKTELANAKLDDPAVAGVFNERHRQQEPERKVEENVVRKEEPPKPEVKEEKKPEVREEQKIDFVKMAGMEVQNVPRPEGVNGISFSVGKGVQFNVPSQQQPKPKEEKPIRFEVSYADRKRAQNLLQQQQQSMENMDLLATQLYLQNTTNHRYDLTDPKLIETMGQLREARDQLVKKDGSAKEKLNLNHKDIVSIHEANQQKQKDGQPKEKGMEMEGQKPPEPVVPNVPF